LHSGKTSRNVVGQAHGKIRAAARFLQAPRKLFHAWSAQTSRYAASARELFQVDCAILREVFCCGTRDLFSKLLSADARVYKSVTDPRPQRWQRH